jgi:hypothetical protein
MIYSLEFADFINYFVFADPLFISELIYRLRCFLGDFDNSNKTDLPTYLPIYLAFLLMW